MEVEFQISKEEYVEFYKTQLKENFKKRIPFIAVIFFFVASAGYTDHHFDWIKTTIAIISCGLLISLFYFIPFWIFSYKLRKLIASDPGYSEPRKWIIEEEGLRSESQSANTVRIWESFTTAKANEKYISITLVDKRFLLIPKRSFSSDAEATNFLGLLQSKILKSQGYSNLNINRSIRFKKKDKPPYAMGLFGLIPVVGAMVGVALILYGILIYKNKWLVSIGAGGIFFSVAFYSFFNYANKNLFSGGFVVVDKRTLNSLVKEIEFYKIQRGSYPDRLQQLDIKNQFISLQDPLLSNEKNNSFNYHLVGKGYTLFSSGMDKTPNTRDDIYPTLEIDTNKMGLIIDRK